MAHDPTRPSGPPTIMRSLGTLSADAARAPTCWLGVARVTVVDRC